MNTKTIALIAALLIAVPQSAEASKTSVKNTTITTPSLAILDTGLDTSLPFFAGKIVHEVCFVGWSTCPNGSGFQEGPGSAVVNPKFINTNGFDHGTQMAYIALATNPNMNIVFVRIVGNTSDGRRQIVPDSTIEGALKWVLANKDKYNIQAVAMAQGSMSRNTSATDYCVKIPTVTSAVDALVAAGVPSFFPNGNDRNYNKINWPACIPSAVAVGSTDQMGSINLYTNHDKSLTDFFSLGNAKVMVPGGSMINGAGTSISVQTAAANWIKLKSAKPNLSYQETYNLILKTGKATKNSRIPTGILFDVNGAING